MEHKSIESANKYSDLNKELEYLTTHDELTGLHSRIHFEHELEEINFNVQHPFSVVIADINGLKIVNEVFGFNEGDLLLKKVAAVLTETAGAGSIAARWGGDEFALILPGADAIAAEQICEQIMEKCAKVEECLIKPSLSLGSGTRESAIQNVKQILLKAEERMYRHKLLEPQSTHSSIISALRKALLEKSFETEEHAQRMRKMSMEIGKAIGLSADELDDLCLLSVLHDIGKIAIADKILTKPGKLTDDEWIDMKRHSEIGYHIAAASNELSDIAEYILSHHERWDGNGYPQGLKENEIPKLSQIVSIIDTYDVMTNERPYKKAKSRNEALEEIKRCSGTQFSPHIADVFRSISQDTL